MTGSEFQALEPRELALAQGTIRYRELGNGHPIVLVHGLLTNSLLWAEVAELLARDFRVIAPDWPLGAHTTPLHPGADLTPPALAQLIADFISTLELENVTLVGNDTGGALCQLVAVDHPERLGRLVLTPCDAYENFPPPMFRPLMLAARSPRARGGPALNQHPVHARRRQAIWPVRTAGAARMGTRGSVLQARLCRAAGSGLPDARLELIEDSYTFVSIDQPRRTAELIASFAREPVTAPSSPRTHETAP